jgi:hypothetical protein
VVGCFEPPTELGLDWGLEDSTPATRPTLDAANKKPDANAFRLMGNCDEGACYFGMRFSV